ncbi:hypothetical protein WICANDRAFT_93166 [Wickerhamomyces anomalus NRRL Y-366-8]|uniref:Uncharacterized protein n=1 Tax=Wickerhamomyces anomalus (strain ATCC 58044 / CBS 1984 / NCYC 433 / NRRL Y-366-8) TaxID=683960 RepID=A0A1E3P192_WICAA|nr:uncharacterized protein WICANDRAFT_93166 [Wickerhamomyces anomalus NRRL Y-366-8]ODQ58687.1 hypothetical protein WICANDRAFT_93166 [Wickerhamomyces anomalus NRRL Y-366-8]
MEMEYTGCESEVTQALYHCLIYPLTKLFNIVYNMTLKASYGIRLEDTMIPEFPRFERTKHGSTVFSDVKGKRGVHLVLEAGKPFLSQLFNSKERGFNRQYRDFYDCKERFAYRWCINAFYPFQSNRYRKWKFD